MDPREGIIVILHEYRGLLQVRFAVNWSDQLNGGGWESESENAAFFYFFLRIMSCCACGQC